MLKVQRDVPGCFSSVQGLRARCCHLALCLVFAALIVAQQCDAVPVPSLRGSTVITDVPAWLRDGSVFSVLHVPTRLLSTVGSQEKALEAQGMLYNVELQSDPDSRPYMVLTPVGPAATSAGVGEDGTAGAGAGPAIQPRQEGLTPSEAGAALTISMTGTTGQTTPGVLLLGTVAVHASKLASAAADAAQPPARPAALPSPDNTSSPAAAADDSLGDDDSAAQASVLPHTPAASISSPSSNWSSLVSPSPSSSSAMQATNGSDGVLTILHFNDWHNRMEPCTESWHALCDKASDGRCNGGLARMSQWLKDNRAKHGRDTLVLNSGDDFIGTVWDRKYGVDQPAHFLGKALNSINVSVVGNHEFDWGADKLSAYVSKLPYPVLGACNLDIPRWHSLKGLLRTYVSYDLQGVKVCVVGLATRDVSSERTYPLKVLDPYWYGKNCVINARKDGCQVVILLSHLGYTADLVAAQLIPGVDLIVGGHSHSLLWSGSAPAWDKHKGACDKVWGPYPTWVNSKVESGKKVPVVQAGWGSRYMGTVRIWLKPAKDRNGSSVVQGITGQPALLGGSDSDAPYSQDHDLVEEIRKWHYWH